MQRLALRNVHIAFAAVKILDQVGVFGEAVGRENIAGVHRQTVGAELALGMLKRVDVLQPLDDFRVAENFVAGDFHCAHFVLPAFVNGIIDIHHVGRGPLQFHVLDFKIKITVVAVKIAQPVAVAVEIFLLKITAAGEPGKKPAPPDLEFAAQRFLRKRRRADEFDIGDFDLGAFLNVEGDGAVAGGFLDVEDIFHLRVGVAVFFIQLFHLLHVGEQFLFVQRLAHLDRDFFLQLGFADFAGTFDFDGGHARPCLDQIRQHHTAVIGLRHRDADVVKLAGAVKQVHIVLREAGQIC